MQRWLKRILVRRRPRHVNDMVLKPRQRVVQLRQQPLVLEISSRSLARLLQRYWVRAGVGVLVIASLVVFVSRNVGRANVATLYATSCLGGWENPQLAEGKPDIESEKADAELFTSTNSAQLKAASAQIFCGSFRGEVPKEVQPKKVMLRLSWAVLGAAPAVPASGAGVPIAPPTEEPPVIIEGTVKPEQVESIIDSSEGQSAELHAGEPAAEALPAEAPAAPAPEPAPALAPEPAPSPETSWLPWRVPVAAAQELEALPVAPNGSTAAATDPILESSSAAPEATATETIAPVEPTSTQPEATATAPEIPADPPFLQLLYTLDGKDWIKLADVSAANWRNLAVELPLTSWEELATVQVSLQTVPSLADQPVVLLDSVRLEVEYADDAASVPDQPDFNRDTVLQLLHAEPYYAMNIFSASRQRHELWIYEDMGGGGWQRPAVESEYDFNQPIALKDNILFFLGLGSQTMNAYDVTSRTYSSQTIDPAQPGISLQFGSQKKQVQWSTGSAEAGAGRFSFSSADSLPEPEQDQATERSLAELLASIGGSAALIDVSGAEATTTTEATTTAVSTSTLPIPVDVAPAEVIPVEISPAEPEIPVALPALDKPVVPPEPEPTLIQE